MLNSNPLYVLNTFSRNIASRSVRADTLLCNFVKLAMFVTHNPLHIITGSISIYVLFLVCQVFFLLSGNQVGWSLSRKVRFWQALFLMVCVKVTEFLCLKCIQCQRYD